MLKVTVVVDVVVVHDVVALWEDRHLHRCRESVLRCCSGQDVPSEWYSSSSFPLRVACTHKT